MDQVGILVNPTKTDAFPRINEIVEWLRDREIQIHVESDAPYLPDQQDSFVHHDRREELCTEPDIVVVFGGDGTILNTAHYAAGSNTPLLGVNSGGLGFLTETTLGEVESLLEQVLNGEYELEQRMMITGQRARGSDDSIQALNDLVLSRSKLGRVVKFRAYVGDDFVTEYVCDGIIISTPTGSTAYNLSAQGPIIHPSMEGLIVNPICPHTLTNRPLILPADAELRFQVESDEECLLTADGQHRITDLTQSDSVVIRRSEQTVSLIKPGDRTFYEILRSKLQWSGTAEP